jgi:hypothetical protein
MILHEVSSALITPRDLEFYPARPGTGSPKFVPKGTRVQYAVDRTGDFGDDIILRLTLPKLVMGYKTYVWASTYADAEEARNDGFTIRG